MHWSSLTNIKFHEKYRESISPPVLPASRAGARPWENTKILRAHTRAQDWKVRETFANLKKCVDMEMTAKKRRFRKKGEGKVFARKHIWVAQIGENSRPIIFLDKRNIEQMHGNEMKGGGGGGVERCPSTNYDSADTIDLAPFSAMGACLQNRLASICIWQAVPSNLSTITIATIIPARAWCPDQKSQRWMTNQLAQQQ